MNPPNQPGPTIARRAGAQQSRLRIELPTKEADRRDSPAPTCKPEMGFFAGNVLGGPNLCEEAVDLGEQDV
jgi:hypothetical protein